MNAKTDYFLKALNVLSWIIFIGLCVQAGGIIVNTFITLWLNPAGAGKFWMEINLIELHQYNQSFFITLASQLIIVAVLKAIMFYLIVKTFHDKKLTLSEPFTMGNQVHRKFNCTRGKPAQHPTDGIGRRRCLVFYGCCTTGHCTHF